MSVLDERKKQNIWTSKNCHFGLISGIKLNQYFIQPRLCFFQNHRRKYNKYNNVFSTVRRKIFVLIRKKKKKTEEESRRFIVFSEEKKRRWAPMSVTTAECAVYAAQTPAVKHCAKQKTWSIFLGGKISLCTVYKSTASQTYVLDIHWPAGLQSRKWVEHHDQENRIRRRLSTVRKRTARNNVQPSKQQQIVIYIQIYI